MTSNKKPLVDTPLWVFAKWLMISVFIGLGAGAVGVFFHFTLEWCTQTRQANHYIIFFLPLAGLVIVWLYKRFGAGDRGTDMVLTAIRSDESMRAVTAPLIFMGTALTHLFGGSAGREGAALQIGGSVATQIGRLFRPGEKDKHIIVMCGASAAFAALFGTPITAAIFSLEVTSVGLMYYSAIVPCTVAAITGAVLARACGIAPTAFLLSEIPSPDPRSLLQALLLGILCAAVSILFCRAIHSAGALFRRRLPNIYLRVATGGGLIILLTLLAGNGAYNGAGM
ncbi:MAG: chloride channel protein, partial [Angelakisella sp.]